MRSYSERSPDLIPYTAHGGWIMNAKSLLLELFQNRRNMTDEYVRKTIEVTADLGNKNIPQIGRPEPVSGIIEFKKRFFESGE